MKLSELLTPDHWCKFDLAIDQYGDRIAPESTTAERFCLTGAIIHLEKNDPLFDGRTARHKLFSRVDSIIGFNDSHTYEEVITLLKELDL